MKLESYGQYNNLSDQLRAELNERIDSFGKTVTYRFAISNPDPHPEKKGQPVWPSIYTLDPKTFTIKDPHNPKGKMLRIGMVKSVNEKGEPDSFDCVRVREVDGGKVTLNLETVEGRDVAMYMELQPKTRNGMFPDPTKRQVVERVDYKVEATKTRQERSAKLKALQLAEAMELKDVKQFAAAMEWDEMTDEEILRSMIEAEAEKEPGTFLKLVESDALEVRATIKRALDRRVIAFDPSNYQFLWVANNQPAAALQVSEEKGEVAAFADWVQSGGDSAKKVYQKIKSLLK
jgi:hypothetical protein